MWRIIRAEIRCNRLNFLVVLVLISLVSSLNSYHQIGHMFAWMMAFLGVNNWLAFRIKDKRDLQLVQLPVAAGKVAMARILMILLPAAVFLSVFGLQAHLINPARPVNPRVIFMLFSLVISIFSLALIFRDTFIGSKALKQGKIVLVVLLGAAVLVNLYTFMIARRIAGTQVEPPALIRFIRFIGRHNPSTSDLFTVLCLAVGFLLAFLTIVTFKRRRSHIE